MGERRKMKKEKEAEGQAGRVPEVFVGLCNFIVKIIRFCFKMSFKKNIFFS